MATLRLLLAALLACLVVSGVEGWKLTRWAQHSLAVASVASSVAVFCPVGEVLAVSGGGKDFATKDLKGDLSFKGADNRGKDFTQVDGKGVSFEKAQLAGSRFYRAQLEGASFVGADLTGASLEDAGLEKAVFTDAVLKSSYLSSSFELVGSIANADFSEALIPEKTNKLLCARTDAAGTNPVTGADTRDSLMCP